MGPETEAMARARDLFRAGEVHSAMEAAQVAAERAPRNPEAWWLLARVSRHTGLVQASDQAFRRAAELSRAKRLPHRPGPEGFRRLLEEARVELSPDAARRLANTELVIEPLPSAAAIKEGTDPDAPSKRLRRPVDRLVLYQDNLENRAFDAHELRALLVRILSRA